MFTRYVAKSFEYYTTKCPRLWYNARVEISKYRYDEELGFTIEGTPAEAEMLARCARECSRDAVRRAFAAGLSITVVRDGNRIVKVAPDGTETFIKYVEPI